MGNIAEHFDEGAAETTGDQWAEAALGEDTRGRALLIYCRAALCMYEFNEILLKLPLDLVAAQHLEGRRQARFWLSESVGSGLAWPRRMNPGPLLPNVIGISRKVTEEE